MVIDACRDLAWKEDWYPVARMSNELRKKTLLKWQAKLAEPLWRIDSRITAIYITAYRFAA